MADLRAFGLGSRLAVVLERSGITTSDELLALTEREVLALPGVGPVAVAKLRAVLDAAGCDLAHDEFAPYMCVRHGKPAWDVNLADLFLCDECAEKWQTNAFGGADAEYVGPVLDGYCLACNQHRELRLRQWLLCGNCERVARSIGRGVAAERFLAEQWMALIKPIAAHLDLRQTDEPTLRGRRRDGSTSSKVASIDFAATDTGLRVDVFGFELKTGKKYISGRGRPGGQMSEFQLDTTDCDDITTVMTRDAIPVYLIHVQVIDRAHPPTARYVPLGAWWTDPWRMGSTGFKRIQQRSRETRDAAYFNTAIFEDFVTFADHLARDDHRRLAERLASSGVPSLYRR